LIVLDTNIASELSKRDGHELIRKWTSSLDMAELFLSVPVVSEMAFGAELYFLRTGSSKHLIGLRVLLEGQFNGRVLEFSLTAAMLAGRFRAIRERAGRPVSAMDMAIAGIAAANNATLATRNIRDFEGLDLKLINPFEAWEPD
jgi:toxin FitB